MCFFVGPFALFSALCPCDEKGGRRGYGHHHDGYHHDNGADAMLTGVVVGAALAGGDGGDWGGDGGDFGGDGGDWGGDD